jgi:hypothetical protein
MWDRSCNAVSRHAPGAIVSAALLAVLALPAPRGACAAEFAGLARCFLDGSIRAHVLDYASGQPLAHARVTLIGTPFAGIADKSGALRLRGVPAGMYRARIECRGYLTTPATLRRPTPPA